jgi:hypothetical protein
MLVEAHRHSSRHRREIWSSDLCGCFYCEKTFPPAAIVRWINAGDTAKCPECGIDSVLGSASGYPITPDFLHAMHLRWFG